MGKQETKAWMVIQAARDVYFSTAVTSLKHEYGADTNRVKCVVDNHGYAIYLSKGLIPYNKLGKVNPQFPLLHLGIQVIKVNNDAHAVNIPEDVAKIESLMQERNIS